MSEIWKAIPGYEGFYEVSILGAVRSVSRLVGGRWGTRPFRGASMAQNKNKDGYLYLNLRRDGGIRKFLVHRLVLSAFLPLNESDAMQVNHIDGVKTNNHLSNLEWCTSFENMRHAVHVLKRQLGKAPKTERKFCAKGHALEGNAYPDPRRHIGVACATCNKASVKAYKDRKRAEKSLKEPA